MLVGHCLNIATVPSVGHNVFFKVLAISHILFKKTYICCNDCVQDILRKLSEKILLVKQFLSICMLGNVEICC